VSYSADFVSRVSFFGLRVIAHPQERRRLEIEAAFSRAVLTTFVGSSIPASLKFLNLPDFASKPNKGSWDSRIFLAIVFPSNPEFAAI
jgi:hypothetical protein